MLGFVCVELEYYFNNNPPAALERHYAAFRPPFSKGGGVTGQSPVSPLAKGEILKETKRRRGEKPPRGFSVGNPRRGFPITR